MTTMSRDEELAKAIRQKDVAAICQMLFEGQPPRPRTGFNTEAELWDFKRDVPEPGANQAHRWAALAKDVVGFHNHRGGVIVFGISDALQFAPISIRLDSKLVNDRLRRYVGDLLWCEYHREAIQPDQRYLGVLVIPPRGARILRFESDAQDERGRLIFKAGDSAFREGDSTRLLRGVEVGELARRLALPASTKQFEVDEPYFRILAPDYSHFVERPELAPRIEAALTDPRTSTTSLVGIGGAGKTALATWAVLRAYERKDFSIIVSVTAKDRELTPTGILGLQPLMSSFDALLDSIVEVIGLPDIKAFDIDKKELEVRTLLKNSRALLFVDNLETVDDGRIITFLDELPLGVRAIVTSRRARVRVAARPVDIGPLTEAEVRQFVRSLASLPGFGYVAELKASEVDRVGAACDRIPLAVRWALARASSAAEALYIADQITKSGRRGEELLEFAFRRVFDGMTIEERRVLEALALFQAPLAPEALLVGAAASAGAATDPRLLDAIERLVDDALVQRVFDPGLNDYAYALLPVTRAFVAAELSKEKERADAIRGRLTDYFEARDVRDPDARLALREARQGKSGTETSVLDLAIGARHRGDIGTAAQLFEQALARNPRSWKVARAYAEFERHSRKNTTEALRLYEQAASNAPSRGSDRALIFREYGMLLRDSGLADGTSRAITCFEEALKEAPNDEVAAHALSTMLGRQGQYGRVISVCEPLLESKRLGTREAAAKSLLTAYDRVGDRIKLAKLRDRLPQLGVKLI